MLEQIPTEDFQKYKQFINKYLDQDERLAGISKRLQNHGVSPELARELVRVVALSHTQKQREKALMGIGFGIAGVILFSIIGLNSRRSGRYFFMAIGFFAAGLITYFASMKRYRYLKSIS